MFDVLSLVVYQRASKQGAGACCTALVHETQSQHTATPTYHSTVQQLLQRQRIL
jgi:hypothetical protein